MLEPHRSSSGGVAARSPKEPRALAALLCKPRTASAADSVHRRRIEPRPLDA